MTSSTYDFLTLKLSRELEKGGTGTFVLGRSALHGHADDILAPEEHQAQHPLLFSLVGLRGLGLQLPAMREEKKCTVPCLPR